MLVFNRTIVHGAAFALASLGVFAAGVLLYFGQVPPTVSSLSLDEPETISFLAIGDQGTGQIPQRRVAYAMAAAAKADPDIRFCILLGDNFYGDGVQSVDDWQWRWKFESVYSDKVFWRMPFFAVLGNHDYLGKVDAQINYSLYNHGSNRFRLPARQYVRDFGRVNSRTLARIAFIDSNDTDNNYQAARAFIQESFNGDESSPIWRIVAAHHPLRSQGRYHNDVSLLNALKPILIEADVQLYLAGHDHNLQLIAEPGEPVIAISGGGGASLHQQTGAMGSLRYFNESHGYLKVDVSEEAIHLEFKPLGYELPYPYSIHRENSRVHFE